ncbi:hypothetical protein CfE428DRAFT_3413 [Chthoniobacter flavus Ellin428]|uniref:Uncharacterized protein n=1 Tax=Chthoniobacter flavus Ellin428 TaxID=497964 RepID=B4D3C5_9BACT|nr:hypothetical protein CfE428DRAFT_3413 [Chthoniobacter flavus Ellin428]TCO88079.1 hypothetical protein EV701_119123 [Chthoniobacter flavus]
MCFASLFNLAGPALLGVLAIPGVVLLAILAHIIFNKKSALPPPLPGAPTPGPSQLNIGSVLLVLLVVGWMLVILYCDFGPHR